MADSSFEFLSMASQASQAYLQQGIALDDAIAKIASARDLSRVQIQRVVELANHETNEQLMKKAEDKTFRFDVASVDGVLSKLGVTPQADPGMPKVAGFQIRAAMKSYHDTAADKNFVVKTASAIVEDSATHKQLRVKGAMDNCIKIATYIANARRDIMVKRAGLEVEIREAMQDLTQFAKNNIANGRSIGELHKFACCYDRENGPMWDVVFKSVKDGIVKTAKMNGRVDMKVAPLAAREPDPDHRYVTYEVIRGNRNLLIGLDTLKNKCSEEDRLSNRLRLMDTLGPAVICCIKELRTSDDVAKHIAEDIEKSAASANDVDLVNNLREVFADFGLFGEETEKIAGKTIKKIKRTGGRVAKGAGLAAMLAGLYLTGQSARGGGEAAAEAMRPYKPAAFGGVDMGVSREKFSPTVE